MQTLWRNGAQTLRLTICLVAVVTTGGTAWGQPVSSHFESIEWMAADSTLVLYGTIVGVKTEQEEEHDVWQTVAFRVEETLKGEKRTTVRFAVDASGSGDKINLWRNEGRPLIVFLDDSRKLAARMAGSSGLSGRRYVRFSVAPRSGYVSDSFLELADDAKTPAYTLALQRLKKPEEVLQAVKQPLAAPQEPGQLHECSIRLPNRGNLDTLTVPIDARLEEAARQWVLSKEMDFREEGAIALLYFQSKANADLLKGLLDDPGFITLVKDKGGRAVDDTRIYRVRENAWQVLQAWGIDVPRPVIREPIADYAH